MKVGNIEVKSAGAEVQLKITTGKNWELTFARGVCNDYHAELEVHDIYQGLRDHRKQLQREVLDFLRRSGLPGVRRGKLAKELERVEAVYGL